MITLDQPDTEDCQLLGVDSSSYLAVVTSQTFDSTGTQFEYVEARYIPSIFHFHDTATRTPLPSKRHGADSSLINLFNKKAGGRAMRTPAQYRDDMSVTFYT